MDKIGIIVAKIGSLFVSTVNLVAYVACFPIDHPFLMIFIFGMAGVYLNRIEWNNHPLYMAFKKVLIELIHVLIRITGSQETNWAASIASYSIGQYCCHCLENIRLKSGFYISTVTPGTTWIDQTDSKRSSNLTVRGHFRSNFDLEVRHFKF